MKKISVVEAHEAAVAQMDAVSLDLHRTDCAICQDLSRPQDRTSGKGDE